MTTSIAIATHNRAAELALTLSSLQQLDTAGAEAHEIIVVDNRSTDETEAVVRRFIPDFCGRLRYVHEPKLGLSQARNRAVEEARYDVVAFLDDDVMVDPGWLRALQAAFRQDDCAVVGGRAYLVFPGERPRWLTRRLEGCLTYVECGPVRRAADAEELYGVNLSVRKRWFEEVGLFQTCLGRVGTCLIGSEETDLLRRIGQAGGKLVYDPDAVVGHRVNPRRLRRSWFWARCYWGHLGETRALRAEAVSWYDFLRRSVWLARAGRSLLAASLTHSLRSPEWFDTSTVLACRVGAWWGLTTRLAHKLAPLPSRSTNPKSGLSAPASRRLRSWWHKLVQLRQTVRYL
jgi:glycosyltransferase involved in cell wall biosynthesis